MVVLGTLVPTDFVEEMIEEPYLIVKSESAEKTWKELSAKLADPDVVSNPTEYQKLLLSCPVTPVST
ncbi:hypothetical protein Droror1_Dr00005282 [Drosera rotundifolia]